MEMQQIFEWLLAGQTEMMDSSQAKATKQEEMLAEMDAKMDSNQKEIVLKKREKETETTLYECVCEREKINLDHCDNSDLWVTD
jgi:glutamate racemase